MRPPFTALAVTIALAASAALASPTADLDAPPGLALVALAGDDVVAVAVPLRFGGEHDGFALRTVLAFGGNALLPTSYAFVLGPAQPTEPLPSTTDFLRDRGFDDAGIAAFLSVDRDAQLVMLVPPEALRAAVVAGRTPDLDEVERSIPPDVAGDLRAWRERRASGARAHVAELIVRAPRPDGTLALHHGAGIVEVRFDEAAQDAEDAGGPRYAGLFWGSYEGEGGTVWVDGRFTGVPFELGVHPLFETRRQRWDPERDGPHASRFEALWPEPMAVVGVSVAVPPAWDALAHHLSVELLLEPGGWTRVAGTPLPPAAPVAAGSSLADDPGAVAFLVARGGTVAQFEHAVGRGQGPLLLRSWQAQGVAREDVPRALLERIEAEPAPTAAPAAADGAGWTQRPPGLLEPKALAFTLPAPVRALGVRFELHGMPFGGEHWTLGVEASPAAPAGGAMTYGWRYDHGW